MMPPRFDVVFVNRDLLEGNVRYEKFLMRQNPRVIFDFDDAIFLDGKAAAYRMDLVGMRRG